LRTLLKLLRLQESRIGHEIEVSEGLGHSLNGMTSTSSISMSDATDQVELLLALNVTAKR
jgi:hypothetical protein